ncbi:MAG: hypothetical protein JJE25_06210 [Bacteroidia bacterium]|nr:hypothetical protein [Bacteroidia bacterium]
MKNILVTIGRMLKTTSAALIVLLFVYSKAGAQTNIGGIINIYTPVTAITNSCGCPTTNCATITVTSAAGFAANDVVLLIQMKGARADSSNTPTHGDILNLYDAGNYEFDTINSIAGNVITIKIPLKNTYFTNSTPTDSARVQLIRVPVYSGNVNVTSTLTPQAWNGSTGGVLVFWLTGTLTLQANISADGMGFNPPVHVTLPVACDLDTAFYYQSTIWNHASCTSCGYSYDDATTRRVGQASYGGCGTTCYTNRMNSNDNKSAAFRGEGIVANTFMKTFANSNVAYFTKGKGHWGNGGGGGGNHNAGGAGGGNYGGGGWGGKMYNVSSTDCPTAGFPSRQAYGGVALTPTATKVFLGGSGGEGHDNGGQGSTGTTGGGIIMIKAANIANSASYTISANGTDQTIMGTNDGNGGGGAGGSILLDVSGSYTNAVTISAKGGYGGSQNQSSCHGTGGGGGGGLIWFSTSGGSVPANVTTNVAGGAPGSNVNPSFNCGTATWGATAGNAGGVLTGLASGASVFLNINDCSTALPVELVSFNAAVLKDNILLDWATASEVNNNYFIVQRRTEVDSMRDYLRLPGAGNSTVTRNYSITDYQPFNGISYYRLVQVDFNGHHSYFDWVKVSWHPQHSMLISPVPFHSGLLRVELPVRPRYLCRLSICDIKGRIIYEEKMQPELFASEATLSNINFPANGIYMLTAEIDGMVYHDKISVNLE